MPARFFTKCNGKKGGNNNFGNQGSGGSGNRNNVLTFTKRAENVKEVKCSDYTTWYIDLDNNLYGCGRGDFGQQGSGDTNNVLTFAQIEIEE